MIIAAAIGPATGTIAKIAPAKPEIAATINVITNKIPILPLICYFAISFNSARDFIKIPLNIINKTTCSVNNILTYTIIYCKAKN